MKFLVGTLGTLALLAGCTPSTTQRLRLPPLHIVAHVELSRYLGRWYEIASFPQGFQRDYTATTATYTLVSEGAIRVQKTKSSSASELRDTRHQGSYEHCSQRDLLVLLANNG